MQIIKAFSLLFIAFIFFGFSAASVVTANNAFIGFAGLILGVLFYLMAHAFGPGPCLRTHGRSPGPAARTFPSAPGLHLRLGH